MAATPPSPTVDRAIGATVEYFRRTGDTTAADSLQATVDERRAPGTICLLGRAGAGRSTLLNTLAQSPAALPASPAGTGTVTRAPVTANADINGTTVVLVDLPGIGVTSSGPEGTVDLHLAQADAALFIVDAHIPLSDEEIGELRNAQRLVPEIVVVVAQRDQNIRALHEVMFRNRQATELPMFITSCLPGIHDPGLADLRSWLLSRTSDRDPATEPVAVRQARVLVDRELDHQRILAASPSSSMPESGTTTVTVADIDARLRELSDLPRINRTFLSDHLAAARSRALGEYGDALAHLQKRWRRYFDETRPARIFAEPEPVIARLGSELSRLKQDALGQVMRTCRSDFLEFTAGEGNWDEVTRRIAAAWDGATSRVPDGTAPDKARLGDIVSPSLLTVTVSGGGALAYAATLLPGVGGAVAATGGLATLPVIAAAGTWLTVNLLHGAAGKGRRNLRGWLDETVAAARRDLSRDLDEVYHQLRPVILTRFQTDVTAYVSAEKHRLTSAKESLLAGEKDAENARDLATRRVAHLEKIQEMLT